MIYGERIIGRLGQGYRVINGRETDLSFVYIASHEPPVTKDGKMLVVSLLLPKYQPESTERMNEVIAEAKALLDAERDKAA